MAGVPRVAVRTLGCKVNRTESEAIAAELLDSGVELAAPDLADVIVVNTCTVTGEADAKARKEVRRALSAAGEPVVVVTGCLASVDPAAFGPRTPRLVVEPDKGQVASRVREALAIRADEREASARDVATAMPSAAPEAHAAPRVFNTRVMVKVQDGCDDRCAYCIVPDARGHARSVRAADVVERVACLVAGGTAEVVLTGINLGRYADGDVDLAALVRLVADTGATRIRLSSIEPRDLTGGLLAALAATPAVSPHLHIPLQSGCDRTLAAMGRPYDTADFARALLSARTALPHLAVTTDVIAGFSGETDADHADSLAFVEACAFARLHVFRYSSRAGTPAAARADQVPPPLRATRALELRALGERLAAQRAASRVGSTAAVLIERITGPDAIGTSEDGLRVTVRDCAGPVGSIVACRLVEAHGRAVLAVLE